jgi:hypothetical protein
MADHTALVDDKSLRNPVNSIIDGDSSAGVDNMLKVVSILLKVLLCEILFILVIDSDRKSVV